jgi:fluoride exporter
MRSGRLTSHGWAVVAVASGGAAGASGRWLVGHLWGDAGAWPWPTFVANVVGCLLLGAIAARLPFVPRQATLWREGLGVGFCGGLTTFSTFTVEAAELVRDGRAALAVGYLGASLATGWIAYELGRRVMHHRSSRSRARATAGVPS